MWTLSCSIWDLVRNQGPLQLEREHGVFSHWSGSQTFFLWGWGVLSPQSVSGLNSTKISHISNGQKLLVARVFLTLGSEEVPLIYLLCSGSIFPLFKNQSPLLSAKVPWVLSHLRDSYALFLHSESPDKFYNVRSVELTGDLSKRMKLAILNFQKWRQNRNDTISLFELSHL